MKMNNSPIKLTLERRWVHKGVAIAFYLLLVCSALSIAFVYESTTLWYKIGMDKTMLRTGQLFGLLTAVQLLFQIILAVRGKSLEELFGVATLMRWHRANGIAISLFAMCHVALVLAPEGITNFPIGKKYWPEMVGVLLFLVILSMAVSSLFRQQLGLVYARWRVVHRVFGYSALVLTTVHVLFVSDSFRESVPKIALASGVTAVIIFVLIVKLKGRRKQVRRKT